MNAYWSWSLLNPGMLRITHDAKAAENCMRLLYGVEFHQAYSSLPMEVMRTDLWKYAIIYAFGGIYSDIDTTAVLPVSSWLPPGKDGEYWPPKNSALISLTWEDCSLLTGLEVDEVFNTFVSRA